MSKSSHHIETSLHKLQRLGSVLSAVFAALTVATVVLAVALAINVGAHVGRDAHVTSFGVIEGPASASTSCRPSHGSPLRLCSR